MSSSCCSDMMSPVGTAVKSFEVLKPHFSSHCADKNFVGTAVKSFEVLKQNRSGHSRNT
mgnify:CR=1 FL=1